MKQNEKYQLHRSDAGESLGSARGLFEETRRGRNVVQSTNSSIIGGAGNTIPVNMANSHIIGSGLTAVAPNTLHANCLNAVNTPAGPGTLPSGTVYYITAGSPIPAGARALYIVP